MPNRLLRDWTGSEKINSLTPHAERFFTRLIMKADDYGCFYGDVRLLKANLFPLLLDGVREADISRWMAECQMAGLIVLYEAKSKPYVQIADFGQRLRQKTEKFPLPSHDSIVRADDSSPPHEEKGSRREVEVEGKGNALTITGSNLFRKPVIPSKNEVLESFVQNGGNKEMAKAFYSKWESVGWYRNNSPIENFRTMVYSFIKIWNSNENKNGKSEDNELAATGRKITEDKGRNTLSRS